MNSHNLFQGVVVKVSAIAAIFGWKREEDEENGSSTNEVAVVFRSNDPPPEIQRAHDLVWEAWHLPAQDKVGKQQLYEEAVAIYKKEQGPQYYMVNGMMDYLEEVYKEQDKFGELENIHKFQLAELEKFLGPNHPDLAQQLSRLADFYCTQHRREEAIPLLKRAIEIGSVEIEKDQPSITSLRTNLAMLYYQTGQYELAEPLFESVLPVYESKFDKWPFDRQGILICLASVYGKLGKTEAAKATYQKVISGYQQLSLNGITHLDSLIKDIKETMNRL